MRFPACGSQDLSQIDGNQYVIGKEARMKE
jgi:hypothetical protein